VAKRILIITDHTRVAWEDSIKNEAADISVLTLGFNGSFPSNNGIRPIDTSSFAEDSQEMIRKFVPSVIYELPRKETSKGHNLLKLFNMGSFNLWWLLNISEKSVLVNPMIKRLYYIEMVKRTIAQGDYQEVCLDLDDKTVEHCLKKNSIILPPLKVFNQRMINLAGSFFWFELLFGLVKSLFESILRVQAVKFIGLSKINKFADAKGKTVFFSFFPFFWNLSATDNEADVFFRELPEYLGKFSNSCYLAWINYGPRKVLQQRKRIKEVFSKKNIFPIEHYLSAKVFLKTAFQSALLIFKIAKYRSGVMGNIKISYGGYDVSNIVVDELNASILSSELMTSLLLINAGDNLGLNGSDSLVYRLEFQPFEKALIYGTKKKCRVIAFQHQAIARNHLQYFFANGEIAGYYSDLDNPDSLPLPDKYFVTGEYQKEVLVRNGFPIKDIGICGPVRYTGLLAYIKDHPPMGSLRQKFGYIPAQKIFLVLAPVIKEEVLNLILQLLQATKKAANENNYDYLYLIKSHPAFKFDGYIKELINENFPGLKYEFLADNINLNDHIVISDAVMLTTTTIGIEAICLGVPPILFENSCAFSLNPMLEIKSSCVCINGPSELEGVLISLLKGNDIIANISKNWPNAIRELFYNIKEDPNYRFRMLLDKSVLCN